MPHRHHLGHSAKAAAAKKKGQIFDVRSGTIQYNERMETRRPSKWTCYVTMSDAGSDTIEDPLVPGFDILPSPTQRIISCVCTRDPLQAGF